ncbi:hypothetical protein BBJ28_00026719 [Nothophytophthora sp. Chile5]|nr:hypothetical protein BBJ28_00026719 [Nothophytophthora sp. Chile5]
MTRTLDKFYPGIAGKARETKRKNIHFWAKHKREKIQGECVTESGSKQRRTRDLGVATVLPQPAEEEIVVWIKSLRDDGVPVSAFMLQTKCVEVAAAYGVSTDYFKASWSFRWGFMRRHALTLRRPTRQGQQSPPDADAKAVAFRNKVLDLMREHKVDRVFNADQTAVFFEYLPKHTVSDRGTKTVWVRCGGKDKERVTVMLLGDSLGNKFTPFIIAKSRPPKDETKAEANRQERQGFGVHVWKEVTALQARHDAVIYGNQRGWWNGALSVAFLHHHFGGRPRDSSPVLLLWDDFSAHWTEEVSACARDLNVVLVPVPPGCTSVCQPADISWNRPLKLRLRTQWIENLQTQLSQPREHSEKFKLQPPTRKGVVEWAVSAWAALSQATIMSGFSFIFRNSTTTAPSEMEGEAAANAIASSVVVAELEHHDQIDVNVGEVSAVDDVIERFLTKAVEGITAADEIAAVVSGVSDSN